MKKIIYKGVEYYYKSDCNNTYYGSTSIYSTTDTETKGFLWWRKKVPKFLFEVDINFDSPRHNKKYLKYEFKRAFKIYNKKIEIEKREKIEL